MTVLATWLDISINLLLFVFVVVCLLMSMIILMQRPKNEGLGAAFGSNTTDQLFGARTTNVLQRGTVYLATLFFVITLTLAVLMNKRNSSNQTLVAEAKPAAEAVAPDKPAGESPIEAEAVTPPVQVPAETPAATPQETTPEGDSAPAQTPAGETKPAEESAPAEETPPATEQTPPAEQP